MDIHERAKMRFLESIDSFECCGAVWKNGERCLGRNCPVEAERQRAIARHAAQQPTEKRGRGVKDNGFDPKCLELAEYFMDAPGYTAEQREQLAQEIQDAIEGYLFAYATVNMREVSPTAEKEPKR